VKFTHNGEDYDFSFPRVDNKVSRGHRGFDITCNGKMSFEEASIRRDFTINAMGYDIEEQSFIDPFNGRDDMQKKILRHIDGNSFIEDPLRVYRALQFCARFEYGLAEDTIRLCQDMINSNQLDELPKERIYIEFKKLLLKSQKPSIGFNLMRELGVLRYFPQLQAIIDVPQSPKWHPEGDVWTHTLLALDEMAKLKTGDEKRDIKLLFSVLCHDFGKATHTQITENRVSSIGHEIAGVEPTKSFLRRLTNESDLIRGVSKLVKYHMIPTQYFINRAKDRTIRRLSTKIDIEELIIVARADFLGRRTDESLSGIYMAGDWLLQKSKELGVYNRPPKPLIQGRDLISIGLEPSKEFKNILKRVYNAQINGEVSNYQEAISFIENN
jgi:tRNA nucleotidyltransferase (CCA-adding enzyme)